ncbi:GNAT family N-acetyltransferase [Cytophagaceae bacterium DM2B3-1]|uniref:GNAT family N-acetyltransferase n=1 Tax=Xanthocytophaga flava TaxID=3048013 RepID=A0ABT7CV22_9BACT|nr:GNAT family N-acetyltransferase [Xanthocytophaga flavus]MDJ1497614.1 GNAT family N-acetyltransferase [Xanthocytophaga flavus]
MIKATINEKSLIVDILSQSFESNQSVNYIIPQDSKRKKRIRKLMEYSFDVCYEFGEIFLSDDRTACALVILPDTKKSTLSSTIRDVKFILFSTGLGKVKLVLDREAKIKALHPTTPFYHLWYIGVLPASQGKGIGRKLLSEIIQRAKELSRSIYLETSTLRNLPFYKKFGFETFAQLEFSYRLHLLRLPVSATEPVTDSGNTKSQATLVHKFTSSGPSSNQH